MIVSKESLGFALLVEQRKQFEDIILDSGRLFFFYNFLTFHRLNLITRLIYNECNHSECKFIFDMQHADTQKIILYFFCKNTEFFLGPKALL